MNGPLPMHDRHRRLRGALRTLNAPRQPKPEVISDDGGAHWTISDIDRHQALALAIACQTSSDTTLWPLGMVLGQMLFPEREEEEAS